MMNTAQIMQPPTVAEEPRVEHVRELRGLELTMAQMEVVDLIVGRVAGPVTVHALQQAAFRLQRRHPSLRARFVLPRGGKTRPTVEFCEPSLARICVEQVKTPNGLPNPTAPLWQRVVEREANRPFESTDGYMFRIHWVPQSEDDGYVVLCAQHALVDGISLMRLLHDLLSETSKIASAPAMTRNDGYSLEPLQPTSPLLAQCPVRFYERIATRLAFGALVRSQRHYDSPFPVASALDPGEQPETHCRFQLGGAENYQPILAACKAHGTTVGAAFSAATQLASLRLIRTLTGDGASGRVKFPMTMDFNMRGSISGGSKTQDSVGLLMGACGVGISVPETITFWELARKLKKKSEAQLRLRQPLLFHQAMDRLWDLEQTLDDYGIDYRQSGGVAESVNISNVGQYPYPVRNGSLTLREVFGVNSCMKGGPMFIVWLRSLDGRFHYNATSAYPASSRQSGDRLLWLLVRLMERCHLPSYDSLTLRDYVNRGSSRTPDEASNEPM